VVNLRERARTAAVFLGRNMALFISFLSLGVAALSLYFSISTQRIDRLYKEISIVPRLGIKVDTDDFSISLANVGLGPAIITRVRFGIAGKCYDSIDTKNHEDRLREFTESVLTYGVYKDVIPHRTRDNKPLVLPITQHRFGEGTTIRQGDTYPYITVDPVAIKDIRALERVEVIAIKQRFSDAVAQIPLSIVYCSVTELFCDVTGTNNDMCDLAAHP